ncbi:MAG: SGNH/GDSL hydrolase family protein [Chloroflexota bacterium]
MAQRISLTDPRLSWAGAVSVEHINGWSMPWRIEHTQRRLFHTGLVERAAMPAGVRLTFRTNSTTLAGRVRTNGDAPVMDICSDGELMASISLLGTDAFSIEGLPADDKLIELWLPHFGQVRFHSLAIDEEASLSLHVDPQPRWITYGSSISQCRTAPTPTQTWPGIVARNYNLNLTCLGFGGQCHLDAMIARQIRDMAADMISLCVGINIYGNGSLNPRSFSPAILGFVQIVRESHPSTPIVLMSPIFSPEREETINSAGFTLVQMREDVQASVETLKSMGDENIHYVHGLDILGADLAHLLPDSLHPDAEGYRIMGERIGKLMVEQYFGQNMQHIT